MHGTEVALDMIAEGPDSLPWLQMEESIFQNPGPTTAESSSGSQKYTCATCGVFFDNPHAYGGHIKSCKKRNDASSTHTDSQKYTCATCGTCFANPQAYGGHVKTCRKRSANGDAKPVLALKCPICCKGGFTNKQSYGGHIARCREATNELRQKAGNKLSSNSSASSSKGKNQPSKPTECPICGKGDFTSKQSYGGHVARCRQAANKLLEKANEKAPPASSATSSKAKEQPCVLECPICGKGDFTSKQSYGGHVARCRESFIKLRKQSREKASSALSATGRKGKSPSGNKLRKQSREKAPSALTATSRNAKSPSGKPTECPICGKRDFASRYAYGGHVARCRESAAATSPEDGPLALRAWISTHPCLVCGVKGFTTIREYAAHVSRCKIDQIAAARKAKKSSRKSGRRQTFTCATCGACFANSREYGRHMKNCTSADADPKATLARKCPICGKGDFTSSQSYGGHLARCRDAANRRLNAGRGESTLGDVRQLKKSKLGTANWDLRDEFLPLVGEEIEIYNWDATWTAAKVEERQGDIFTLSYLLPSQGCYRKERRNLRSDELWIPKHIVGLRAYVVSLGKFALVLKNNGFVRLANGSKIHISRRDMQFGLHQLPKKGQRVLIPRRAHFREKLVGGWKESTPKRYGSMMFLTNTRSNGSKEYLIKLEDDELPQYFSAGEFKILNEWSPIQREKDGMKSDAGFVGILNLSGMYATKASRLARLAKHRLKRRNLKFGTLKYAVRRTNALCRKRKSDGSFFNAKSPLSKRSKRNTSVPTSVSYFIPNNNRKRGRSKQPKLSEVAFLRAYSIHGKHWDKIAESLGVSAVECKIYAVKLHAKLKRRPLDGANGQEAVTSESQPSAGKETSGCMGITSKSRFFFHTKSITASKAGSSPSNHAHGTQEMEDVPNTNYCILSSAFPRGDCDWSNIRGTKKPERTRLTRQLRSLLGVDSALPFPELLRCAVDSFRALRNAQQGNDEIEQR